MAFWLKLDTAAKLAIVPRPRGEDWLDDEVHSLRKDGVDVLVSFLTCEEEDEHGLNNEAMRCQEVGIEFRNFPIPDRQFPESSKAFRSFVEELRVQWLRGRNIGAHCRAGIGRSSLLLASLLCIEGYSADDAFEFPDTPEQVEWVRTFNSSA